MFRFKFVVVGRSFNFGNFHLNCCALSPFELFLTMRAIQASSNYDFCTLFNLRFRCEHTHTHTHMNARILSLSLFLILSVQVFELKLKVK